MFSVGRDGSVARPISASAYLGLRARRAPALDRGDECLGARRERPGLVVDHMEMTLDAYPAQAHLLEPAGVELASHRIDRHERHAEPGHHGLLDRFRVTQLHRSADPDPGL